MIAADVAYFAAGQWATLAVVAVACVGVVCLVSFAVRYRRRNEESDQ